jgi:hypothetical protein
MLADGRHIAYEEKGVEKRMAKPSLLVLHGVPSSLITGMLGKLFWVWGEEDTCWICLSHLGFGEKKTNVRFCSNELAGRNVDNF